jgi:CsoR family transcriptional regulator, copper-sensing transcriptional repressor
MTTAATPAHDLRISHLAVRCIADRTTPGLRVPTCTAATPRHGHTVRSQRGRRSIGRESRMYGYTQNKNNYLVRLRRIEGQIRGLQRIVEDDKYCIDILTQVAAATKALQSVALGLLEEHLSHCVAGAIAEGGDDAAAKVREASESIARLVRF